MFIRKDYKLKKIAHEKWSWGHKDKEKMTITLNKERTLILKTNDKVKLNKLEFNYFCEQLLRSGSRVFSSAKNINAHISRKGCLSTEEKGHVGYVAINNDGDFISLQSKPEMFISPGDFTLDRNVECPNILIVNGNLTINGNFDSNLIYDLTEKAITCNSLMIVGQDTKLPDIKQLDYESYVLFG